jgi:hypothetical protein
MVITRPKLNEHEGQVDQLEVHASSHVENVFDEDDNPAFHDMPLEPSYGVVNTSTHDRDVDSTQDEFFQSTSVDSTPYSTYDTYDDEGIIAPEHDEVLGVDEFPLGVDLSSQELRIKDDKRDDDLGSVDRLFN